MSLELIVALSALFVGIAVTSGLLASSLLGRG
jgi:hypothetical protein